MKQLSSYIFILLFILTTFTCYNQSVDNSLFVKYGVYDVDGIKPEEYQQRRSLVMAKMDSGSIAIFCAANPYNRSKDTYYKYRQNSNFLYLTGCNESNSTLLLIPDGMQIDSVTTAKEILFVRAHKKSWTGNNLGVQGSKDVLGFGRNGTASVALTTDSLIDILPRILQSRKILYYVSPLPKKILDQIVDINIASMDEVEKVLETKYSNLVLKKPDSLVNELRVIKSPAELTLIQMAINATTSAHIEVMKSCEPRMYEYQLQAVVEFCFTKYGCESTAFPSIIGSGPNTMSFHYEANRRQMHSGELVVMDIGAEYHGYCADITRTIPVNGRFSQAQKEIYELVLSAQDSAFKEIQPGVLMNTPGKKAMEVISTGLMMLGIIKDKDETKKYTQHSFSHFIGLDIHDVGSKDKLQSGMIFTVEPGIYIPESSTCDEKYRGIGIRIEDDVIVTESGYRVLSIDAPRTITDIEQVMKLKGIGNSGIGRN
jgi:Xaa-Pro aminopeptidase